MANLFIAVDLMWVIVCYPNNTVFKFVRQPKEFQVRANCPLYWKSGLTSSSFFSLLNLLDSYAHPQYSYSFEKNISVIIVIQIDYWRTPSFTGDSIKTVYYEIEEASHLNAMNKQTEGQEYESPFPLEVQHKNIPYSLTPNKCWHQYIINNLIVFAFLFSVFPHAAYKTTVTFNIHISTIPDNLMCKHAQGHFMKKKKIGI